MKRSVTVAGCAVLVMLATDVMAQTAPTQTGCSLTVNFTFTAGCGRAATSRQLLIHNADVLNNIVAGNLAAGPESVEPAGLTNTSNEETANRLAASLGIRIEPTADAAVQAAPSPLWNAWIDGKYTWQDNAASLGDLDGPLWNGLAGIDYKISDSFTFGVIGSYEDSRLDGSLGAEQDSDGWGIGPYIGIVLTPNIVFTSSFLYSAIDTDFEPGAVDYDSDRIQAAAALTGYWYQGTWRFTPALSVSWSKEWMEETTGVAADEIIETGILTPSLQIGNTLVFSGANTVEPWLGAALDWTFISETEIIGFGTDNDPSLDLRVQGGLNFGFGTNVQLSLIGEVGGIIENEFNTYSGEAMLSVQF